MKEEAFGPFSLLEAMLLMRRAMQLYNGAAVEKGNEFSGDRIDKLALEIYFYVLYRSMFKNGGIPRKNIKAVKRGKLDELAVSVAKFNGRKKPPAKYEMSKSISSLVDAGMLVYGKGPRLNDKETKKYVFLKPTKGWLAAFKKRQLKKKQNYFKDYNNK